MLGVDLGPLLADTANVVVIVGAALSIVHAVRALQKKARTSVVTF